MTVNVPKSSLVSYELIVSVYGTGVTTEGDIEGLMYVNGVKSECVEVNIDGNEDKMMKLLVCIIVLLLHFELTVELSVITLVVIEGSIYRSVNYYVTS